MKIIDYARKGNVVRFYLGEKTPEWGWTNPDYKIQGITPSWLHPNDIYYGDDWDNNRENDKVYDEFVKGYRDISFPFDALVMEAFDDMGILLISKDNLRDKVYPCLIVIPKESLEKAEIKYEWQIGSVARAMAIPGRQLFYFGDDMKPEETKEKTDGRNS